MKITVNKILGVFFIIAMYIQLFSINEEATAHVQTVKTHKNPFIDSVGITKENPMFEISEHNVITENINHFNKPKQYRMSRRGLAFIKSHESCVLHAYNDPDPKRRSVGWGHQIQPGENLEHITKAKADELFEKDVEWVNDAINRLLSKTDSRFIYSQGFIDGLGDLIYNCGERGVTLTEFWDRLQKCRYDKYTPGYINKNDLAYTIAGVKTSRISAKGHISRRYETHLLMMD